MMKNKPSGHTAINQNGTVVATVLASQSERMGSIHLGFNKQQMMKYEKEVSNFEKQGQLTVTRFVKIKEQVKKCHGFWDFGGIM